MELESSMAPLLLSLSSVLDKLSSFSCFWSLGGAFSTCTFAWLLGASSTTREQEASVGESWSPSGAACLLSTGWPFNLSSCKGGKAKSSHTSGSNNMPPSNGNWWQIIFIYFSLWKIDATIVKSKLENIELKYCYFQAWNLDFFSTWLDFLLL